MNKYDRDIRDIKNTLAELTEVVTELCDRMNENEAMMARNNGGTEPIKFPPNSPFAGHDSYYEEYDAGDDCPPGVLTAMYFGTNEEVDFDIPLMFNSDGVFYRKNGKFAEIGNDVDSFLLVGNYERPYGLFVPTTLSAEGARKTADFFNSIVRSYDEVDRTVRAIKMTQGR